MYALHRRWGFFSVIFLAAASATRSNGAAMCMFLVARAAMAAVALCRVAGSKHVGGDGEGLRGKEGEGGRGRVGWRVWCGLGSMTLALCFAAVAPLLAFDAYGKARLCGDMAAGLSDEWCASTFSSAYHHIQQKHWNVGLFRYWRLQQLPNFLLATPILLLAARGLGGYAAWAVAEVRRVFASCYIRRTDASSDAAFPAREPAVDCHPTVQRQ